MSLPNVFTLSRIPMMFLIVALLYAKWRGAASAAFVFYVMAGVTDFLDGYLARKQGRVSNFGILMDAVTDKVLLLGVMIAIVDLNRLPLPDPWPVFLVLLIMGREFLITGIRLVAASKGVVVSADRGGKQKTVTQIIAVGALLLAGVIGADLARWLPPDIATFATFWCSQLGLALFILATLFTLSSGVRYFRRYASLVFAE